MLHEFGQVLGKGDAMWRALDVVRGELVVYLDSDTRDFSPHFATGMLGPLLCSRGLRFVKASSAGSPYTRADGLFTPADGGRVTELAARPLLSAFYPELAGFVQPLAGEVAARASSSSASRSPPATPSRRRCSSTPATRSAAPRDGAGRPRRAAQPAPAAHAARPMAYAVLRVILERLRADGRLLDDHAAPPDREWRPGAGRDRGRPPYATLRARA